MRKLTAVETETLRQLRDHPGWSTLRALMCEEITAQRNYICSQQVATPEEIAAHNHDVGGLAARISLFEEDGLKSIVENYGTTEAEMPSADEDDVERTETSGPGRRRGRSFPRGAY